MGRQQHAPCVLLAMLALLACACGAQAALSYTNVYGRLTCYAEATVKPYTTQQLADVIKQFSASAKAAGKPLRIRTSRSVFHSTATFTCPYSSDLVAAPVTSKAAPSTAAVLLENFDKILEVDRTNYIVRAQSGLKVLDLLRWAEKNGMSAPLGAPCNYAELTLGGVIASDGHGTGSNTSSTMADIALEFTWVDPSGKVHTSSRDSPEGRGLAGGVGLWGIITEVKLQMTPPSNTKAISINLIKDGNIGVEVQGYAKNYPNMAVMWRPDFKMYNAFLMAPTTEPAQKGDFAGLIFPLPTLMSNAFQTILLPLQADVSNTPVTSALNVANCAFSLSSLVYIRWAGKAIVPVVPGAPLNIAIPQAVGVGSTNVMMAGGCEPFCLWNSELTVDDNEFAIELEDLPAWAEDVKKITRMDLQENGKALDRCIPFGSYVFMRFGKGNNDFSSITSGMKSPVYLEVTFIKTRKLTHVPAKYQYYMDAIEQLTLCKYKGRPHWGKNTDRTFTHPDCGIRAQLPHFDKQLEMQAKYDPEHVFEPPLMRKVIDATPFSYFPQCDLRRMCYCKEDVHCARGFACVPSQAFPEYRICKPAHDAKLAVTRVLG